MKTTHQSGFHAVEILIVIAICGLLAAIAIPNFQKACKTQAEHNQALRLEGYGHPATPEQLNDKDVYEVVAVWRDPANLQPVFYTFLRDKSNSLLLWEFSKEYANGFYRANATNLVPLQPVTLEKR